MAVSRPPRDASEIRALLEEEAPRRDRLLEYLHRVHDAEGHLAPRHLGEIATWLKISEAEVFEVASFYHHFDLPGDDTVEPADLTVRVCDSIGCMLAGSEALFADLEQNLPGNVRLQRVPCIGRCADAPAAVVGQRPVAAATTERITALIEAAEIHAPLPDAIDLQSYRNDGGYALWRDCQAGRLTRPEVQRRLAESGVRGLGGAGFPAARKWELVCAHPGPRLLAVNADEGEPGTFKDRDCLEHDPHRFIEGMLIAAWYVQAEAIYIYLRDEYAGIRQLLTEQLAHLRETFAQELPEIELRRGAGAYVCGEESAMLESLEGHRGIPRQRPPYVAETGLFGLPTLVHNVETLYWIREAISTPAATFAPEGRQGSRGWRNISVSGRVARPGVVRVPAGISVRELIDEYCGGMTPGHELYAYLPGGTSGGILPARLADLPLDFDTLQAHGAFLGSAAVIILSQQDRARDAALNAMRFLAHESCGQCTPCRVGTTKAVALMEAPRWDRELVGELADVLADASICGLGQAAANPLRCMLKYFPEEIGG